MKRIFFYVFAMLVALTIQSCENEQDISAADVPQPVITAFQIKYPGITATGWEKATEDGKTIYEGLFKRDDKNVEAQFDENGNFIKEE
jgi:hypothetical protein